MADQAGPSIAALQARQAQLVGRHGTVCESDRVLTEVLASAHAAMREGVRRLDAIAEEIDRAVEYQGDLALDTPLGAREFRRFLVAKQHEVSAVVADALELARAKTAVLEELRSQYTG